MSLPDARDLNTASVKFVVRSKETGQLLGSALLLPEVTVKDGDVQFVPWSENEDNVPAFIQCKHTSFRLDQNILLSIPSKEIYQERLHLV